MQGFTYPKGQNSLNEGREAKGAAPVEDAARRSVHLGAATHVHGFAGDVVRGC